VPPVVVIIVRFTYISYISFTANLHLERLFEHTRCIGRRNLELAAHIPPVTSLGHRARILLRRRRSYELSKFCVRLDQTAPSKWQRDFFLHGHRNVVIVPRGIDGISHLERSQVIALFGFKHLNFEFHSQAFKPCL
jgi:hypothetical protein